MTRQRWESLCDWWWETQACARLNALYAWVERLECWLTSRGWICSPAYPCGDRLRQLPSWREAFALKPPTENWNAVWYLEVEYGYGIEYFACARDHVFMRQGRVSSEPDADD
jgi:hypothetical protein